MRSPLKDREPRDAAVPIVSCSSCQTKLNAPDSAIGKKVKCRCGQLVDVPAAVSGTTPAKAQPAPTNSSKAQASKSQSASPKPNPAVAKSNMGQLLDELTQSDFSRAEKKEESTGPSRSQRNSKALEAFKDPDTKSKKGKGFNDGSGGRAGGSVEDLNPIAIIFLVFGGLHLVATILPLILSLIGGVETAVVSVPILIMAAIPTAGYDIATGIGLLKRKAWGWWLAAIGIGWVCGGTLPFVWGTIRAIIAIAQGKLEMTAAIVVLAMGGIGIAITLALFWSLNQMI
ncbi:MAG: hypothetical protein ACKOAU_01725, partial [Pirellula sp.]